MTKGSKKYNRKRNLYLGYISKKERNWDFTDYWLDPWLNVPIRSSEFKERVYRPAYRAQILSHRSEMKRLKDHWTQGNCLITDSMRAAHGHLRILEKLVAEMP